MKTIQRLFIALLTALLLSSVCSRAEDIDIYSGNTSTTVGLPNVLIILDNSANWNSPFTNEKSALVNTVNGLNNTVNIGLMMFAETGGGNDNVDGSYVRFGIRSMNTTNKTALANMVNGLDILNDKSNNAVYGLTMREAYLYYAGLPSVSGFGKVKRDYAGNTVNNPLAANLAGNPFTSAGSTTYVSPVSDGCQKNFIIFISNGPANDNASATSTATSALSTAGGSTTTIALNPNGSQSNIADEWAKFLSNNDVNSTVAGTQTIRTYTVDVNPGTTGQGPDHTALLKSMAAQGKGKYFAVTGDSTAISKALLSILNEIQAVNSVFSSSSLPVSVNAQGTYLNQIYMGMFRPDEGGAPRWLGNLKQYQFAYVGGSSALTLADSQVPPQSAISSGGTGFISPNAISFWTTKDTSVQPDSSGGFWINQPSGAGGGFDLSDGELVEKGGAAQVLRLANLNNTYTAAPASTTNPRKLYTYFSNAQLSATANAFDSSNASITDAQLGTGTRSVTLTSAAAILATSFTPNTGSAPATIAITSFSKPSAVVTATVASTAALTSGVTQIKVSTTNSKYDCSACVITIVDATHFTYTGQNGGGTVPAGVTANILANFVNVSKTAHLMPVGQNMTISNCTTHTTLNGTDATVSSVTGVDLFVIATSVNLGSVAVDTTCRYAPKIATATSANHGFANGDTVTISGAAVAGYNLTVPITVIDTNTFTYQYTATAPLAASSATATGSTTKTNLTQWVRGFDNNGDEAGPGSAVSNVRPSIHGDVLHSRPTVINYGGSTGVVVYYGGNDGVYRAINGNQTGTGAGSELWGFIPTEFFGKLKRQHDNSPLLQLPSTPSGITPTPQRKDYFADGSTGVYQVLNADATTSTAYIYLAMRRGGRLMYALDVSTPSNPQYLWKKTNTGDFAELGQTWSQPKVTLVKGYSNPVLIFGAGYDPAQDNQPPTANTMGRGIFIVDAITGAMVWEAVPSCSGITAACKAVSGMVYSIPSDLTLLDRNSDGKIDRLYATDTGGNVWRVDLEPSAGFAPANWNVTKLAALGCNGGTCASGTTPRKFFYPADVISTNAYDAVLIGSGDREHPMFADGSYGVTNRFYMLKDISGNDGTGTVTTETNLFDATSTPYADTLNGYYVTLGTGEKVVNAPTTVAGYTYFGTNTPIDPATVASCSTNLGIAKGYKLSPFTGVDTSVVYDGGGLPPTAVAGLVDVNGKIETFCIGCGGDTACVGSDCKTAIGAGPPTIDVSSRRHRGYWYIQGK
jgi:Tfp pilus tip-associated adhesin PilY1